jgi:hypothetical protein
MKSYILRGVDASLRKRLTDSGVIFYEWDANDVIVESSQYAWALECLNATGSEKDSAEYENMVVVTLKYGRAAAAEGKAAAQQAVLSEQEKARAQARQGYIQACSARLRDAVDFATRDSAAKQQRLSPVASRLFTLARQAHVAANPPGAAGSGERYQEEFKRMREVAKISGVRVGNGVILLYTELIHATKTGASQRHELGKFIIIVRTDGQGDPIRWLNQTRRVDGIRPSMHAPYVLGSGAPLASGVQETFVQLIAQLDFAIVAELAIQFLETVDNNEPGKYICHWPSA